MACRLHHRCLISRCLHFLLSLVFSSFSRLNKNDYVWWSECVCAKYCTAVNVSFRQVFDIKWLITVFGAIVEFLLSHLCQPAMLRPSSMPLWPLFPCEFVSNLFFFCDDSVVWMALVCHARIWAEAFIIRSKSHHSPINFIDQETQLINVRKQSHLTKSSPFFGALLWVRYGGNLQTTCKLCIRNFRPVLDYVAVVIIVMSFADAHHRRNWRNDKECSVILRAPSYRSNFHAKFAFFPSDWNLCAC